MEMIDERKSKMSERKPFLLMGVLDWRALSCNEARASGISYRLASGKEGTITDPVALRTFYYRVFYANQTQNASPSRSWRQTPR